MNEPTNGTPLAGEQLKQALEHDAAQKPDPTLVFKTEEVLEALVAPCTVCTVREGVWCAGTVTAPLPNGQMVADFAHAERLALARHDVSNLMERKLAGLRAGLPTGAALRVATHKWEDVLAYADLTMKRAMTETLLRVARELDVDPQWLVKLAHEKEARGRQARAIAVEQAAPAAAGKPTLEDRIESLEKQLALLVGSRDA